MGNSIGLFTLSGGKHNMKQSWTQMQMFSVNGPLLKQTSGATQLFLSFQDNQQLCLLYCPFVCIVI